MKLVISKWGVQKVKEESTYFFGLQRVSYFLQSYGGGAHERWDDEAARGEKRRR